MAFTTAVLPSVDQEVADEKKRLTDAAHKMSFSPEYRYLLDDLHLRAYKLLNDSLAEVGPRSAHTRGRLHAYREIYRVLTNKELFDAAS